MVSTWFRNNNTTPIVQHDVATMAIVAELVARSGRACQVHLVMGDVYSIAVTSTILYRTSTVEMSGDVKRDVMRCPAARE